MCGIPLRYILPLHNNVYITLFDAKDFSSSSLYLVTTTHTQTSFIMPYSQTAGNATWRLQVCVFKIPMGDGNPENIHVLKTSCNNLSETKSIREHSASTVSLLGSALVGFYFKLSLISPQHSLHRWIEKSWTEQSFRCLYTTATTTTRKTMLVSGKRTGALYWGSVSLEALKRNAVWS